MRRNFILLPLLSILPLLVPPETSQRNKFSECSRTSLQCRGLPYVEKFLDISYPFREPSMPPDCGLPGYDVTCKNNNTGSAVLVLEIDKKEYKVRHINYEDQTINLVNTDFLGDPCHRHLTNTTFNLSHFSHTAFNLNLTLHFNCSPDASSSTPNNVSLSLSSRLVPSCPRGSNHHYLYYSLPGDDPRLLAEILGICNSYALIPIRNEPKHQQQGWIYFWDAIHHGFYLNWTSNGTRWCKGCEATGGVCLRELRSPGKPLCSCSDGSVTTNGTCNSNGKSVHV